MRAQRKDEMRRPARPHSSLEVDRRPQSQSQSALTAPPGTMRSRSFRAQWLHSRPLAPIGGDDALAVFSISSRHPTWTATSSQHPSTSRRVLWPARALRQRNATLSPQSWKEVLCSHLYCDMHGLNPLFLWPPCLEQIPSCRQRSGSSERKSLPRIWPMPHSNANSPPSRLQNRNWKPRSERRTFI